MKEQSTLLALLAVILAALATNNPMAAEVTPDSREPLVLRTIMREMGKEMANIVEAISREEWAQVEASALRIANHPRPPMNERMKIMALFGKEMAKFKNYDSRTHDTARELGKMAAQQRDSAVISTFATLQSTCLECHKHFRKPVQEHFYGKKKAE